VAEFTPTTEQVRESYAWERENGGPAFDHWLAQELAKARAEGLKRAILAYRELHHTYGSTTACRGGVGGQALTRHCSDVCHNPVHDPAKAEWEAVEAEYFTIIESLQEGAS